MLKIVEGVVKDTNNYGEIEVIEYINCYKVKVKFLNTGTVIFTSANSIRKGSVRDFNSPNVYGKGYYGYGKYVAKIGDKHTINYSKWRSMIQRCYSDSRPITYKNFSVCDAWLCFQTFSDWFFETYPFNDQGVLFELDKDVKKNPDKVYSPETCTWLTPKLNSILTERTNDRGTEPLGVFKTKNGSFQAQLSLGNGMGSYSLGVYSDKYSAFHSYKVRKESYIKEQAELVKDILPEDAYNALMEYEIVDDSPHKAHLHKHKQTKGTTKNERY